MRTDHTADLCRAKRTFRRLFAAALLISAMALLLTACGERTAEESGTATESVQTSGTADASTGLPETDPGTIPGETTGETTGESGSSTGTDGQTEPDTPAVTTEEEPPFVIPDYDLSGTPQNYLSTAGLNELAPGKNVIYFIVDRFDWEYYVWAKQQCPEIFYHLEDGFTYFSDTISVYPRTYPSIAYMITGVENDFSLSRKEYFKKAYTESDFLRILEQNDFRIGLYTDGYFGYEGYDFLDFYAENAVRKSDPKAEPEYSTDMKQIYEYFQSHPLKVTGTGNGYSFIHLSGTHLPLDYDENFRPSTDENKWDAVSGLKQSFKIINLYLDQLKELGLYEDATIIITGDHCSIGSDKDVPLRYPHITATFVKPAGVKDGGLKESKAQVSHADLFATVLKSVGIPTEGTPYGRSMFEIGEQETRERTYYFQSFQRVNGVSDHEQVVFRITGPGNDYGNWKIVERYYLHKSIYS